MKWSDMFENFATCHEVGGDREAFGCNVVFLLKSEDGFKGLRATAGAMGLIKQIYRTTGDVVLHGSCQRKSQPLRTWDAIAIKKEQQRRVTCRDTCIARMGSACAWLMNEGYVGMTGFEFLSQADLAVFDDDDLGPSKKRVFRQAFQTTLQADGIVVVRNDDGGEFGHWASPVCSGGRRRARELPPRSRPREQSFARPLRHR